MKRAALIAAALTMVQTPPAAAWNARGHMTVAGVAWINLKPQVRVRAAQLLALNPDHATWIAGLAEADRPVHAFMEAATWPDDIRSRYRNDGYTPVDADADLNIGYADRRVRAYWHFKNVPFSNDGTPLRDPFRVNAETQIRALGDSLADPALDDAAKSFNLTWLLHLVGDVHQPLHASARFTATDRNGDSGGNGVIVCRPAPARCQTEGRYADKLHGLWDQAIGTSASAKSAFRKAGELNAVAAQPGTFLGRVVARTNLAAPPEAWIVESFELARKYAYADPIGPGSGPYYPSDKYRADAGSIAEQQVVIGGLRLAALLNRQLGAP